MIEKVVVERSQGRERDVCAEVLRRAMRAAGIPESEVERRLVERGFVELAEGR
ncbi:MAG: hypothetical protein ACRD03_01830 [Acidimicrobiales bacterium]